MAKTKKHPKPTPQTWAERQATLRADRRHRLNQLMWTVGTWVVIVGIALSVVISMATAKPDNDEFNPAEDYSICYDGYAPYRC